METTTLSAATKTIERAFGESASVLDLRTMTEKEEYGYTHPGTTSTSYVERALGCLDGLGKVRNLKNRTMIDNLKISYELDSDISVTLSTETGYDDNLPHNLAAVFAKVIKDSNANADMVIENLKIELDYE